MKTVLLSLFLFLTCRATDLLAGESDPSTTTKIKVQAVRIAEPIHMDGILSESVWQNGFAVSQFKQRDPDEGAEPSEKTIVRIAYDDDALYVGARMYDSAPDSIIARLGRRDARLNSDAFAFFIDPYYDRRSGFYFGVNAAGTYFDGVLYNDDWDDDSWDGVWDGKANMDDKGWTVEIRIPFSQLRFKKKNEYLWGVNFKRIIERKKEQDYLVYTPKDGSGFVSRFADLVGIEDISPARQIEVLPYMRTKAEYISPIAGDPFNDGSRYFPDMGANLKVGLSHNLTLDATLNPDFGQVEVDPAVINLSDVETFFEEKRPFFIEGANTFNFGRGGANSYWNFNWGGPNFFYSRRLGRVPQGSLPAHQYASMPEGTRILGAAKLTGKIGNNWNIGTLHALTNRESARLVKNGERYRQELEPLTYYGILRAQKEFKEGRQGLGVISTFTHRFFKDHRLRNEINSGALTFGVDGWTFLDSQKTWVITGWSGMSQVRGNSTRMLALQQNSQHYFQRPDANHVKLDSSATALTGFAGRMWLNKQKGNVLLNAAFGFIDPKFDVNDVGFMWRGDAINAHVAAGYKWTKPGKFARYAQLTLATFRNYDFDKNLNGSGYFNFGYIQFLNYYSINWAVGYNAKTLDNRRTRGGPLTVDLSSLWGNIGLNTDSRKTWVFGVHTSSGRGKSGWWDFRVDTNIEWKPGTNVSISASPGMNWSHADAQWVGAFTDSLALSTYGKRYVFAEMDQTSVSASIRLNWTFTPKLSLQLYLQPLLSAGDYYHYKELARAKSYDFLRYGEGNSTINEKTLAADPDGPAGPAKSIILPNRDFNIKSLRGNAVLRWEYLPGSVLYLVWTQNRFVYDPNGEFRFGRSVDRLLNANADNIFMVKVTYWWSL